MKYKARLNEEKMQEILEQQSRWLVDQLALIGIEVPLFYLDTRLIPDPERHTVKLQCQITGDYKKFARIAERCFLDSAEQEREVLGHFLCNRIKREDIGNYSPINRYAILRGDIDFGVNYPSIIQSILSSPHINKQALDKSPDIDFDTDREQLFLAWIYEIDKSNTPDHPNWTSQDIIKVCQYLPS